MQQAILFLFATVAIFSIPVGLEAGFDLRATPKGMTEVHWDRYKRSARLWLNLWLAVAWLGGCLSWLFQQRNDQEPALFFALASLIGFLGYLRFQLAMLLKSV